MIIIKLSVKNERAEISQAANALRGGKTLVYPTETFYGLGCIAGNKKAIEKIYRIKGRARNKVLPLLIANLTMAKKYLKFNAIALILVKKYWPGPLSLVLPTTAFGRRILGAADAGVRISSNKFATDLVRALGQPLVSTSANPSNQPAAASASEAIKYFQHRRFQPDLIIDAGKLPKSKGSTFVKVIGRKVIVLREGDISLKIK